jgi:putative salt-induced outer membrane protein
MKHSAIFTAAIVAATMTCTTASAQDALTGVKSLNDRIDDITTAANDDLTSGDDTNRFGFTAANAGWKGSLAASASATSGNTKNRDVSIAGRMTYGSGLWSHSIGFAGEFGSTNGKNDKEKVFGTYEANRYFSDRVYAFGTGRYTQDKFGTLEKDAFIGFGPGFRVLNSADTTWRIQAGPGMRYSKTSSGVETKEGSAILSSRAWFKINDVIAINNDTDVLSSKTSTVATNDLGVNYKMTDTLSTRVSYRTEYNSKPENGFKEFDNTFGVSLVMGF